MSTFLEICTAVNRLTGMQGTYTTASGATGYQKVIADFVADAWVEIQSLRDEWIWMRTSVDISLTQGTDEYSLATIFPAGSTLGKWDTSMILYDDSRLRWWSYDGYVTHKIDEGGETEPSLFAMDPSDSHLFFNPVDTSYTVTAYYWKKPVVLSADGDIPSAPTEYHRLITYRAVMYMANFLGNGDLYQLYNMKADALEGTLMRHQNPAKKIRTRGIA